MTEPTLHSLTQRLDRLERERHCWRVASVLLAAIVVALVSLGAATPPPADLRARSLTILDRSGHSRIRLAVDDDESVLRMVSMLLQTRRYRTLTARSGRERAAARPAVDDEFQAAGHRRQRQGRRIPDEEE